MPPVETETVASTWSVFLSSTIHDFETLRREVQAALLRKAQAACFLSEDWQGGYDDTVEKCRAKLLAANGFLLLLGYWYGSIPPGQDRSITHLEFEWAKERWRDRKFPPVAVMVPKEPSAVEKRLRKAAQDILDAKAARNEIDAAEHDRLLRSFHTSVTGSWRTVTPFVDEHDLRENVIVSCLNWQGQTFMAAAQGRAAAPPPSTSASVSDGQLGLLGRQDQSEALDDVLAAIADHPDEPAAVVVVHGDEDGGQRAFLARLVESTLKRHHPKSRLNRLPLEQHAPAVLASWVAGQLGLVGGGVPQTPEQLADRVAAELKRQPLYFVLDRIGDLAGGVPAFRQLFWAPFHARLRALRVQQRFAHRLIAVLADYGGDQSTWPSSTCAWDAPVIDYSRALLLPRLTPFKRRDVLKWLETLQVPDDPPGRRAQLVDRALKNSGGDDPVPSRVFERLKGETLWPEGVEE
jgi:hypothetical protein